GPAHRPVADVGRFAALGLQELDHLTAAATAAADHEDAPVRQLVEPGADLTHRDVDRARDVSFGELVVLADVEDEGPSSVFGCEGVEIELTGLGRCDLATGLV